MARASLEIVQVLRRTADRIECNTADQWGNTRLCNCGFLAQEIAKLKKEELYTRAMQRHGDSREQLNDASPIGEYAIDDILSDMLTFGFDRDDLKHLERLSDQRVLRNFPEPHHNLQPNAKHDVVKYLKAWANLLELELIDHIMLPSYLSKEETIL